VKSAPLILIFSPSSFGGIAEHTYYQARALQKSGAKVVCLVSPGFLNGRQTDFETIPCLVPPGSAGGLRLLRQLRMAWGIISNRMVLTRQIISRKPDLVLLDSYAEYLSPVWIWPHWLLAKFSRFKYAANLHDPVRNHVVGPRWWHRLSVWLAYRTIDFVLVHDKLPLPSPVPPHVRVIQVPVGVYDISGPALTPEFVRKEWGVTGDKKVFLAFGFVRDGKNLDLAIRALEKVPEAFLVVAGSVASSNDKPFSFYRELAANLGVADRCHFFEGFVADDDLGKYFAGTDFVLLTYASSFHSQSGVLNIAARARKPVLASSSPGPLIESVRNFDLGVTVEPDSPDAVSRGMRLMAGFTGNPRWNDYEASAAWDVNALGILQAIE